jgi:CheY-like chemotaxis protein
MIWQARRTRACAWHGEGLRQHGGLTAVARRRYDVILYDRQMPELHGLALCRALARSKALVCQRLMCLTPHLREENTRGSLATCGPP